MRKRKLPADHKSLRRILFECRTFLPWQDNLGSYLDPQLTSTMGCDREEILDSFDPEDYFGSAMIDHYEDGPERIWHGGPPNELIMLYINYPFSWGPTKRAPSFKVAVARWERRFRKEHYLSRSTEIDFPRREWVEKLQKDAWIAKTNIDVDDSEEIPSEVVADAPVIPVEVEPSLAMKAPIPSPSDLNTKAKLDRAILAILEKHGKPILLKSMILKVNDIYKNKETDTRSRGSIIKSLKRLMDDNRVRKCDDCNLGYWLTKWSCPHWQSSP